MFTNNAQKKYCCDSMCKNLEDIRLPLGYNPKSREFYLKYLNSKCSILLIKYCPWCGAKLPTSLRSKFFDVLEEEYAITDPFDPEQEPLVPGEFNSDEW